MIVLAERRAAIEGLERATSRLEKASAACLRWKSGGEWKWRGRDARRLCNEWERAWEDYRIALTISLSLTPRRLNRMQRLLAQLPRRHK